MGIDGVEVELLIVHLILDSRSQISLQSRRNLYVKIFSNFHVNKGAELFGYGLSTSRTSQVPFFVAPLRQRNMPLASSCLR